MELIDVIDTAVKVGLGAAISGLATYWITRLNHDSDRRKEAAKRVHETLVQITERIERYLESLSRCIARLDGIARTGAVPGS